MIRLRLIVPASIVLVVLLAPARSYAVCCGADCCRIGTCWSRGQTNPLNPCEMCDPSTSQSMWTTIPGCVPPADAGPPPIDAGPVVLDAGAVDAGPMLTDAGSSGTDAGSSEPDAGSVESDAGSPGVDAGPAPTDAGSSDPDAGTGPTDAAIGLPDAGMEVEAGGGCAVHPARGASPLGALVALALGALVWRRRRPS